MANFNSAISAIRDNNGFRPNHNDNSYYRVYTIQGYKPIQIRISNHGTHLWTWLDRRYAPSSSINICIVFAENGSTQSDCKIKKILKRGFEVIQYVYNCNILDLNDISLINGAIQNICKNGTYIDPLNNTEKASQKQILKTLNESVGIAANNNNSVEENKNRQYMKQTIKLKESELKRMIYESINEVLNEVGDTPEGLHTLGRLIGRKYKQNGGNTKDDELINLAKYANKRHQDQISKWDDDNDRHSHWYSRKSPDYNTYPQSWFDGFTSEIDTPVH